MLMCNWISDLCSAYLAAAARGPRSARRLRSADGRPRCLGSRQGGGGRGRRRRYQGGRGERRGVGDQDGTRLFRRDGRLADGRCRGARRDAGRTARLLSDRQRGFRSEEHTSELQSLMRISYAVFCLNKKNENNATTTEYT